MNDILFYYDVVCPYAYIASRRIGAVAQATGARIVWRPVLLGGIYRQIAAPQVPASAWAPARAVLGADDLRRQAQQHGIPLHSNPHHPCRTVSAMRLLVGTPEPAREALTHALFKAYHVDGLDVADRGVLDPLARAHGVDPAVIDSAQARQGLYDTTAEAVEHGAFGVPTVVAGGRMWWGQDRLHLVATALGAPRPPLPPEDHSIGGEISFFHDFSSPFSYLASTQIARIAARYGVTVTWRPILLGALFRAIGTPNVPLLAMSAPKRRYYQQDIADWAAWWGVPFRFPSTFPVRTVLPLRVSLLDHRATQPLYQAMWAEDRDIGQPEVVRQVLAENGLDPDLVAQTQQPAVKARLRENTEAAQAAGACGVPTVQVGDALLWGQDRLPLLAALLASGHARA